jgi:hypothetical protein
LSPSTLTSPANPTSAWRCARRIAGALLRRLHRNLGAERPRDSANVVLIGSDHGHELADTDRL